MHAHPRHDRHALLDKPRASGGLGILRLTDLLPPLASHATVRVRTAQLLARGLCRAYRCIAMWAQRCRPVCGLALGIYSYRSNCPLARTARCHQWWAMTWIETWAALRQGIYLMNQLVRGPGCRSLMGHGHAGLKMSGSLLAFQSSRMFLLRRTRMQLTLHRCGPVLSSCALSCAVR